MKTRGYNRKGESVLEKEQAPVSWKHRVRAIILIVILIVIFALCVLRLMQYQIVEGQSYLAQAEKSTMSVVDIPAARGMIVDRYGRSLAQNRVRFNLIFYYPFMERGSENAVIDALLTLMEEMEEEWIDTLPISEKPYTFLEDQSAQADALREKLQLQPYATAENCMDELFSLYDIDPDDPHARKIAAVRYQMTQAGFSKDAPYLFAEDISKELVVQVQEMDFALRGVQIQEDAVREYVSGDIAPHLIGMVGPIYAEEYASLKEEGYALDATIGKMGIESAMESYLRGIDGQLQIEQNADGEIIGQTVLKEPEPGDTVVLTLDMEFQKKVQDILENHIRWLNETAESDEKGKSANAGAIAVLDVKTGEVLALATYPSYDINEYQSNYTELSQTPGNPLFNRALQGTYRPGSTYKTVVATAGLCEGIISPTSTITCNHYYTAFTDYQPECLGWHGSINVQTALQKSCNIFFYETGRLLGIDRINQYASGLGLGVPTGIELPEAVGVQAGPHAQDDWGPGQVVQAAIGQSSNAYTPLQLAVQAMTIANKGVRYEAHLVKSVQSYDYTETILEKEPVIASSIDAESWAFDTVTQGMVLAANSVTGIDPVTNQYVLSNLGYDVAIKTGTPQVTKDTYNSTLVGFSPAWDPEIAVGVVIERGENAKYIMRQVIDAYASVKNGEQRAPEPTDTLLP